jgi:hypothetical protein
MGKLTVYFSVIPTLDLRNRGKPINVRDKDSQPIGLTSILVPSFLECQGRPKLS